MHSAALGHWLLTLLLPGLLMACREPEWAPPDDWWAGPAVECASPYEGFDRLTEETIARGIEEYGRNDGSVKGVLVLFDLDDDGDDDLLLSHNGSSRLYENLGDARFQKRPEAAPLGSHFAAMGAADLTGDRLAELFLLEDTRGWMASSQGPLSWTTAQEIHSSAGMEVHEGQQAKGASMILGDIDGDIDLDLLVLSNNIVDAKPDEAAPAFHALLLNTASGFERSHLLAPADGPGISLVGAFTDRDLDGDLDILVSSDRGDGEFTPQAFFRNDGNDQDGVPILLDDAADVNANLWISGMGLDVLDLNEDGSLDYCLTDTGPIFCMVGTPSGGYVDMTTEWALSPERSEGRYWNAWSMEIVDLDNDGWNDIVAVAGAREGFFGEDEYIQPDAIWRGLPGGGWEEQTDLVGFGDERDHSGMAASDLDGDGFLDLVLAGGDHPVALWMNRCGHGAWVEVDLRGPPPNTHGFGARVILEADGRRRMRELQNVRADGQGPPRLHFGLGGVDVIDRITVVWIDGSQQTIENVPVNRRLTAIHPDSPSLPLP